MMIYKKIPPPPALADIVRFFWVLEGGAPGEAPLLYRLCADGCPGLLVQYGSRFSDCTPSGLQPVPTCFFQGPTDGYSETTVTGVFGLLGVYFYPSAIQILTGVPAGEITGRTIDAGMLLPVRELEERVQEVSTTGERVAVLSQFLLDRLRWSRKQRNTAVEHCIRRLLRVRNGWSVESMAETVGLSPRQFERKFLHEAGLPPKLFSRIARFQGTLLAGAGEIASLTELAYAGGYSDQSHFIRDFREFSGMNPRQYFSHLDDAAESLVRIGD